MIEAPHYTAAGARRDGGFSLPEEYFDGAVNEPVLYESVRAYRNNQRQGTHATKTRSFVSGGNQKPWKQKGTGRARQGSTRAPHWRGGTVFGPQPRDYTTELPRKVRQLARRSALNARAREGALHVIERLAFRAPKTAELAGLLGTLGLADRKVLVLTAGHNEAAYLSGRNLPTVQVLPYHEAAAYEVLWSDAVVVEEGALTGVTPEPLPSEPEGAEGAKAARRATAKPKAAKQARAKKSATAEAAAEPAKAKAPKAAKPKAAKAAPKKKGSK